MLDPNWQAFKFSADRAFGVVTDATSWQALIAMVLTREREWARERARDYLLDGRRDASGIARFGYYPGCHGETLREWAISNGMIEVLDA